MVHRLLSAALSQSLSGRLTSCVCPRRIISVPSSCLHSSHVLGHTVLPVVCDIAVDSCDKDDDGSGDDYDANDATVYE